MILYHGSNVEIEEIILDKCNPVMADRKIRFMMDYVTATVISRIVEEENLSEDEAMKAFYNSEVFDRLCDPETGLYRESGGYVCELYKIEKKYGRLVQLEF